MAAKRSLILAGAKTVFLEQGFGAASMDAVAEAAGVSKMTVYRHFHSKENLFAGMITDLCSRIIGEGLELTSQRPIDEALRDFARKLLETVFAAETIELHRIVIAECRRFPLLGKLFYDSGPEAAIDVLAAYLRRNRHHPRVKPYRSARHAAEQFLDHLRGYAHMRVLLGLQRGLTAHEKRTRIDDALASVLR
jgi:TetR/AcrR family transcriptional regulator, mexJK operon transcriptional repressor